MKSRTFLFAAALLVALSSFEGASAVSSVVKKGARRRLVSKNVLHAHRGLDADAMEAPDLKDVEDLANGALNNATDTWGSFPRWLQYVLAAVGLVIGLVELFAGYRYWDKSVVLIGAYASGLCMYYLLLGTIKASDNKMYFVYAGAGGAAILGGVIFGKFTNLAVFLMGASVGVIVAIVLEPIVWSHIWPSNQSAMLYIGMAVLGLVGGLLVYSFEKTMVVLATTMIGAFLAIGGIGLMVDSEGGIPVHFDTNSSNCDGRCWGYIGGFIGAVVVGMIVQVTVTAKGFDHKKSRNERRQEDDEYDYMAQQGQANVQNGGIRYA